MICSKHACFWDKHKEIVEKRLNFFNKSKKKSAYKDPEQLDSFSSSSTSKQLSGDYKIDNNEVTYARIRWFFKTIVVDVVCDTFQKCL